MSSGESQLRRTPPPPVVKDGAQAGRTVRRDGCRGCLGGDTGDKCAGEQRSYPCAVASFEHMSFFLSGTNGWFCPYAHCGILLQRTHGVNSNAYYSSWPARSRRGTQRNHHRSPAGGHSSPVAPRRATCPTGRSSRHVTTSPSAPIPKHRSTAAPTTTSDAARHCGTDLGSSVGSQPRSPTNVGCRGTGSNNSVASRGRQKTRPNAETQSTSTRRSSRSREHAVATVPVWLRDRQRTTDSRSNSRQTAPSRTCGCLWAATGLVTRKPR